MVQTYEEMVGADGALHKQREQFIKFWTLVKHAHPVQACRSGTRSMLAKVDTWWPQVPASGATLLLHGSGCGRCDCAPLRLVTAPECLWLSRAWHALHDSLTAAALCSTMLFEQHLVSDQFYQAVPEVSFPNVVQQRFEVLRWPSYVNRRRLLHVDSYA